MKITDIQNIKNWITSNLSSQIPGGAFYMKPLETPSDTYVNIEILNEREKDVAYETDLMQFTFISPISKGPIALGTIVDKFKEQFLGNNKTFNGFKVYESYQLGRLDLLSSDKQYYETTLTINLSYVK